MKGSDFCNRVRSLPRIPDREEAIFAAVSRGDMVAWPVVEVGSISVASDYLSIGETDDFVRMPVSGNIAVRICALLGMRMPTPAEVDAIWRAAEVRLPPLRWGSPYDESMLSVDRLEQHSAKIQTQLANFTGCDGLIAGHKKDIVGCDGRHVSIYGWNRAHDEHGWDANGSPIFHPAGSPIQELNGFSHEANYADYSHGLRLVFGGA